MGKVCDYFFKHGKLPVQIEEDHRLLLALIDTGFEALLGSFLVTRVAEELNLLLLILVLTYDHVVVKLDVDIFEFLLHER